MKIIDDPQVGRNAEAARKTVAYKEERLFLEITERIVGLMEDAHVTKAELARRLGCSPAYITKLLSGSTNFTVNTLVRIGNALGVDLKVSLESKSMATPNVADIIALMRLLAKKEPRNEVGIVYLGCKNGVLKGLQEGNWVDVQFNQVSIDRAINKEEYYDKLAVAS